MSAKEIKQRKQFFKELGEILTRRHGQNYHSSYHNQSRVTVDEAAARFGRYIRAARANRRLSLAELARQTSLSEATLVALEQGIILSCDIKTKWLKDLARALAEDEEDFYFLLGREITYRRRWGWLSDWLLRLEGQQLPLTYYFGLQKVISLGFPLYSKPVYAIWSALLFCFVIGGAVLLTPSPPLMQSPSPTKANVFVKTQPTSQFNPVRTEFDFERQDSSVLPVAFIGRKACCIY
jgi:transcriptional regulator with XRE-family HTH domain